MTESGVGSGSGSRSTQGFGRVQTDSAIRASANGAHGLGDSGQCKWTRGFGPAQMDSGIRASANGRGDSGGCVQATHGLGTGQHRDSGGCKRTRRFGRVRQVNTWTRGFGRVRPGNSPHVDSGIRAGALSARAEPLAFNVAPFNALLSAFQLCQRLAAPLRARPRAPLRRSQRFPSSSFSLCSSSFLPLRASLRPSLCARPWSHQHAILFVLLFALLSFLLLSSLQLSSCFPSCSFSCTSS